MKPSKIKVIRTSTIAMSLNILLKGQLKHLNQTFSIIAISNNDEHLKEVHQREGVKTIGLNMERKISLIKDLQSLIGMYLILRKEKPTIIHSITPKAGLISMVAGKMAGVPIRIHTFTGLIFPTKKGLMKSILILMDKLLCKCATHIIPEGKGVKNDLEKYHITHKPLQIIGNGNVNGIDLNYFDPNVISDYDLNCLRAKYNVNEDAFIYTFVGRLVKDKGVNELIKAYKEIDYPNTKLLLVGPFENELDPLLPETKQEIVNNPNIISVGWQDDIRPYLAISQVFVFPSYREGFPNVVMQAGAMGLPSIVTNINGSNEIIKSGYNGIIIDKQNESMLKKAMELLLTDCDTYKYLELNARENIINKYDQHMVWNLLTNLYNKELNKI